MFGAVVDQSFGIEFVPPLPPQTQLLKLALGRGSVRPSVPQRTDGVDERNCITPGCQEPCVMQRAMKPMTGIRTCHSRHPVALHPLHRLHETLTGGFYYLFKKEHQQNHMDIGHE